MTPTLRPYQLELERDVEAAWATGARNVLMRLDTGGGKTVIISRLTEKHRGASVAIAHRNELVGQLSLALARHGVRHNLIAASATVRDIVRQHMDELGRSWYHAGSPHAVAGIDTLIRTPGLESWASQVTQWTTDEGHHVIRDNKWDRGIQLFTHPECRGLLPTATPSRADGKGLGRDADGVADVMVQGPPMRWLIDQGYLCDYRVICPESDMELLESDIGASGDWSTAKLRAAARASHIVGDIVSTYQGRAHERLGVTFCSDTETAAEVTRAYMAAGIRAGLITGKTEGGLRRHTLRQFAARQLMQLVVVDVVSEGFDLPAIEVGSAGRKTASLATFMQQFGRTLRPIYADGYSLASQEGRLAAIAASCKPRALWIDHVGNFLRHGPPDRPRDWTLERRGARASTSGGIPLRVCLACIQPYERVRSVCPYCETPAPPPAERSSPAMVEGDLMELDAETLAALRGEVAKVDVAPHDYWQHATVTQPAIAVQRNTRLHTERHAAQQALRAAMDAWAGVWHAAGDTDREIQRRFWFVFGVDVLSAMALGRVEAEALATRIIELTARST